MRKTPDFGPYLPVSRLEYEISLIVAPNTWSPPMWTRNYGLGIKDRIKHELGIKRGLRTVYIKTALERSNCGEKGNAD